MVQVKGMQAAVSLMHGGFNGPNRAAEEALDMAPDFLAADAGSTDAGPAFLGGERGMTHRGGIKASLEYILPQTVGRGIPFIIGSAGLGGNRTTVGHFREIIEEVAREKGLSFRLAVINSEAGQGLPPKQASRRQDKAAGAVGAADRGRDRPRHPTWWA